MTIDYLRLPAHTGGDEPEASEEPTPTSWRPVDLEAALAGEDLPEPELLARSDGRHLLYRGRVHWFQGESESCKSWLALVGASQVLDAGGRVLWLDFEDDDRGVVARLLALGVPADAIRARFVYVRPDEPLTSRDGFTPAIVDLWALLDDQYDLAVVDGVTEALTVEGLSLIDNADVAKWLRLLPRRIADRTAAAVVVIDHVTKNNGEGQARYAIGAQHKLAGLSGAAYRLEVRRRFSRADLEPVEGVVAITVTKDRPGWVRAHAIGDAVATLSLTAYPDRGVAGVLTPAGAAPPADLALCRAILEHLHVYDGASGRNITEAVPGRAEAVRGALQWMAEAPREWLRVERTGRSHLHFLTDAGRAEFAL